MREPRNIPQRPSLIEHTVLVLRRELSVGTWTGTLPGERELSEVLRVSRPTLRAALSILEREGWFQARQGRVRTIQRAVAERGAVQARVIALLSPVPLSELVPFSEIWLECLREFLGRAGYEVEFHFGARWWHSVAAEKELGLLTQSKPASVWILFCGSERIQRWFAESSVVCVTSGSEHSGVCLPSVDLNHRATCRHATGQLLALGHERVAFLRQGPSSAGDLQSEAGFREAFRSHPQARSQVAEHDGTLPGIRRSLESMLRRSERPTALLVTRPGTALFVASELIRRGFRLPEDLSLVCRDTDRFLEYFVPNIARYEVNPRSHAQRLGRLVLQCASGARPRAQRVRLMPQFRKGESVGPPPDRVGSGGEFR